MKRYFTFIIIIFAFSILNAQETYHFRTDTPQGLSVESSTTSRLSLHYSIAEITVNDVNHSETKGQEILLRGSFGSFAEGLPNLPFENRYIAVPKGAKVCLKVKENGCQTLNDIDLLPAAKVMLNRDAGLPELHKDMSVFGKDANFPTENVTIAQTTQIRGLDVVMLNVTPFRYNPVRKILDIIYDMDIEVIFEGGNGQFGEARYRNPAWDGILHDMVINSDILPEAHYYERLNEAIQNREEGCEYLIIAPDDSAFLAWADTLKLYRTKQGILTKVVSIADCGGNEPENIRNYILNAYENWAIPPAAVLLFGGNCVTNPNLGPKPFIFTSPPSWETYIYPTDNPFADMNGDSIPDMAISRLTPYNASECQQQVMKLIDYELNPPTDPHYYDHPVINSGYQDTKWFAITAQATHNYFRDRLGKHPSNIYMRYYYEDGIHNPPDSIWSVAPNTDAVLDYFGPNGTQYIPYSIGGLDNWIDMENKLPFQHAVNEGSFLTFYRDHSNPNWWPCSRIYTSDVPSFQNERPTFLLSIGCSTNNYWDDWSFDDCIAESFLKSKVGAIGSLGANTVTYSHYNDLTTWGMLDYFWPDFMPTLGCHNEPYFSYPSYALVAGKLFLRQQSFLPYDTDPVKVEKTLNLFSYLGETYLNLYTEYPQPLNVEASPYHANDQWYYTFTAEEGATVCLTHNGEIIQVTRSSGQPQSLTLPQMGIGEQFTLTVTKRNRLRVEQAVTVVSAEQPFVYLKAYHLEDQNGNGQLDYGEYAELVITISNASPIASSGGQFTLLCESPYIEMLQSTAHYPQIEADSMQTIERAFKIKLASNVPDQTIIPFEVRFTEGENSHDDNFSLTANAPLIQIDPEFRPMTADGEPSTHISTEGTSFISFSIRNNGHSSAEHLSADLNIKAPFVSVGTNPRQEKLEPNEQSCFTFELITNPNDVSNAWLQSRLHVQYGEHHVYTDTIIQYGGIFENFETDTLNPVFQWATNTSYGWDYCDEDAYEGRRCFIANSDTIHQSKLLGKLKVPSFKHDFKFSFRYKTDNDEQLVFAINDLEDHLSSKEWQYAEFHSNNPGGVFKFLFTKNDINSTQAMIDDICFPPMHSTIAYAGDNVVVCSENPVELAGAYAYDCDSILWTTDGDGHFDIDTIANPVYFPGSQDMANNNVTLTLTAFGNNTCISKTQIHFVDEISLSAIVGDSVVNKYSHPVSRYSVEPQEGIHYLWQLEPAEAGVIYEYGHEIDIVWNLHEGDAEVTLSVSADNGCVVEPATKTISLIGYDLPEWPSVSFDLYPNPTDGKVNLVIGETLQGKAIVEVYNLLGERMMTKDLHHLQKGEVLCLDLSSFVSGLYIIKLNTENGSCTKKVSVK